MTMGLAGCVDQSQSVSSQTSEQEETRLIATSAATCEIMSRLGLNLVGAPNTTVSVLPKEYEAVEKVGTPMGLDMEKIKALNPTDVIGPDTLEEDWRPKYESIGVPYTFINLKSVQGLYDSMEMLGEKYGKQEEAEKYIKEYEDFMEEYNKKMEGKESPRVLVLMGLPSNYIVATDKSYAGSLVELAGATNVFHDESKDFLNVNPEDILATDPDIIIRTAHGIPLQAIKMFEKEFAENDIWKHFRAVQDGKVYDVDYMLFGMSATFDYPKALEQIQEMMYGEAQ